MLKVFLFFSPNFGNWHFEKLEVEYGIVKLQLVKNK